MRTIRHFAVAAAFGAVVLAYGAAASAGTIEDTKARGAVRCGVSTASPGFAYTDAQGVWRGFNIDFCKAIAAALLGDSSKFEATVLAPVTNFTTLASGGVDVLISNLTWTYNRDNGGGFEFTQVIFYDGQGFAVPKASGVQHVADLKGATICVAQGTTTELNIGDYFTTHNIPYKIVTYADWDAVRVAYDQGRCDAWSLDRSGLAARMQALSKPADHILLPDTISKEPLGPVVRQGDAPWSHLVKWVAFATLAAEELGITSANVDDMRKNAKSPEAKRLLGVGDDLGQKMGVSRDWAYNVIKQVGNYSEIYERNVGEKTPLRLARGANNLYNNGGLLIAPPFR
jgi:general L-amino acid transport system substrate-binding protein